MVVKGVNIDFIVQVLDHFYDTPNGRMWFHQPEFDVYLRSGPREFHRLAYHPLTIGDVTVHEDVRGKGVLSDLLVDVECCARILRCNAVLCENILNPELLNPLARRGYIVRATPPQFDMLKELK